MRTKTTFAAVILLACLGLGLRADDTRDVRAAMAEFDAAINARNVDAVMATLAGSEDLTLFLPNPYMPMRIDGTATARKAFEVFFQNLPKQAAFRVSRHQTIVQVHGDVALTYSYDNFYLNAGELPHVLLCRTTMILVRQQDGGWRILHLHTGTPPDVSDFS
jgi:ketosteroid isomerase-like protein